MAVPGSVGDGLTDEAVWQEIREAWSDRIRPVPGEVIGSHASAATRAFLTSVGLPATGPWDLAFHRDHRLAAPLSRPDGTYLVVGSQDGAALIAVESGSDQLWDLDPGRPAYRRFINSNLALFLLFLGNYSALLPELERMHQERGEAVVAELRERIRARDPAAVDGTATWWGENLYETARGYF
jgi:hypothetical protein